MKQLITLLFSIAFWGSTFGQANDCNFSIKGNVLDETTHQAIPYVTVKVDDSNIYTSTDIDGNFLIEGLCTPSATLIISCFGYCDAVCKHTHEHENAPHIYLKQEVQGLETVTIEASKRNEEGTSSIAQTQINTEDLKLFTTGSIASAISGVQGVTFTSTGSNIQLPVIHGLYGNRILILNNGMKHGFQNWGTDHAPEIDVSSANSITIIKAAAGVRYGPEAIGGAININPDPLHLLEPMYASIGTSYETNGRGINTNFKTGAGFQKWSYFLNGNYTKIGDRHAAEYMLTNSGKEEKAFSFGTRFHGKKIDAKLYYSFVDQNLALLRSSIAESGNAFIEAINSDKPRYIKPFSYTINEPNQLTTHHFLKTEVNWYYTDNARLVFRMGNQLNKRKEFDVRRNSNLPIIDLDLITHDYQLEWNHPSFAGLNGLIGFQFFTQNNDNNPGTNTTAFIPNYNSKRYSFFIVESKKQGDHIFEFGLRYDHENNDVRGRESSQRVFKDNYTFSNTTASIGYVRDLPNHSFFRSNLGAAWRTPNMAELYSFGQHGFKNSYGLLRYYYDENGKLKTDRVITMAESNIEPERGYKFTNEFQTNIGKNRHTVTTYANYIENFIYERPYGIIGTFRGPMPVYIFAQSDAVFVGTDYNWERDWTSELQGNFGLSLLWSQNVSRNEPLINQPPISTNYKITWSKEKLGVFTNSIFSINTRYTFEQFNAPRTVKPEDIIDGKEEVTPESPIFDFKDAPAGYLLLDFAWRAEYKNLELGVTINNLTNTAYRDYLNEMRYFADDMGRNFMISLRYSFYKTNNN